MSKLACSWTKPDLKPSVLVSKKIYNRGSHMNQKHKGAFGSARRQIFKFGPASPHVYKPYIYIWMNIYVYIYILYYIILYIYIYIWTNTHIYIIFGLYYGMPQSRDGLWSPKNYGVYLEIRQDDGGSPRRVTQVAAVEEERPSSVRSSFGGEKFHLGR